jgi:CBS domain-containing protein
VVSTVAETVQEDTSVATALELMLSGNSGLLPVINGDDEFLGLVTMDAMLELCEEWADGASQSVGSIMTRALITAKMDMTLLEAVDLMKRAEVRHLPVISSDGKLQTIVSLRDLTAYQRLAASGSDMPDDASRLCLSEFTGTDVWTTTSDASISAVVRTLRDNRFGCLPIVEEGQLVGIVTETDVLRCFLQGNQTRAPLPPTKAPIRQYMSVVSPSVSPDDPVEKALAIFVESNPSTLLVVRSGEPVGVITQSDLTHSLHVPRFSGIDGVRARFLRRPISEIMTAGVLSIDANRDVSEAAQFLTQQKAHSLIVFDKTEPVGTFGPHEIFSAVAQLRTAGVLRDIMTNMIFEIDCKETLRSALRFLDSAGVRRLIVRDGDHAVGIFGQHEALAAGDKPLDAPVEQLMSSRIVCLPDDTPCYRAAQQAGALGVDEILVSAKGENCGLASASDFVHLLIDRSKSTWADDTVDDIHV